jgi:hypothetical protein
MSRIKVCFDYLRPGVLLMLGALLVALAACSDDPTPPNPVASVSVTPDTLTLMVAQTHDLAVALRSARGDLLSDRAVTWTSSDTTVVTVSAAGRVRAVAAGTAKIFAASEGRSDSARVTVRTPNPAPTLSALSPSTAEVGAPGFELTVTGTSFVAGATVRWNGAARQSTRVSETELRVEIAAADLLAAGSATVQVFNPAPGGGLSNVLSFTIIGPAEENPLPVIGDLVPNMVVAGSQGGSLSVGGSGFIPASRVLLDGVERPTTYYNPGLLHAAITAEDLAIPRTLHVSVMNPAPGGGTSEVRPLEVTATPPNPAPEIQGITPAWVLAGGPSFTLVVRGRNFVPASVVRMRGLDRPTQYVSATELRAQLLAGEIASAGTAGVSVHNPAPGGGTSEAMGLPIYGFADEGAYDLVFEGTTGDGRAAAYLALPALATTYPTILLGGIDAVDPAPSPDGSRIAFVGLGPNGNRDIYVANRDGTGMQRLTDDPGIDDQPAWSPDGTRIAFRSYRAERLGDIWVMNADGTNPVNLTPGTGTAVTDAERPAWSPDGSRIVYAMGYSADRHIWSMRASDGGDKRQLTSTTGRDSEPAWSPNGQVIAFSRRATDGSERILFMTPDGQMVYFPFGAPIAGRAPAWSPNGEWVAYAVTPTAPGGRYEVAVTLIHSPVSLSITGHLPGGPGGREPAWIRRQ